MANQEHVDQLKRNVKEWNQWRNEHLDIKPDLSGVNLSEVNPSGNFSYANLSGATLSGATLSGTTLSGADLSDAILSDAILSYADLSGANLSGANLSRATLKEATLKEAVLKGAMLNSANLSYAILIKANLSGANLSRADLSGATLSDANLSGAILSNADLNGAILRGAILRGAILRGAYRSDANLDDVNLSRTTLIKAKLNEADLSGADLSGANLSEADLSGANLSRADLSNADLSGADLTGTILVRTNLEYATLTNCSVYGIAAWDVQLEGAKQHDLVITVAGQPITIDNLKVAQFIYLLLNNKEIREIIDTITSKVVLILGRFTDERKAVLDALRNELRELNYIPVLFDFNKPASKNITGTVLTLANLARFIIADLTDPSNIPYELGRIVPQCRVPVLPLLVQDDSKKEFSMFSDLEEDYRWVLPIYRYKDISDLLASLKEKIIEPAEQKVKELLGSEKSIGSSNTHTLSS